VSDGEVGGGPPVPKPPPLPERKLETESEEVGCYRRLSMILSCF